MEKDGQEPEGRPELVLPEAPTSMPAPRAPRRILQPRRARSNHFAAALLKQGSYIQTFTQRHQFYPDTYRGPGPQNELLEGMDDLDLRRDGGGGGRPRNYNPRKRRARGMF
jgi:hypothetical protein